MIDSQIFLFQNFVVFFFHLALRFSISFCQLSFLILRLASVHLHHKLEVRIIINSALYHIAVFFEFIFCNNVNWTFLSLLMIILRESVSFICCLISSFFSKIIWLNFSFSSLICFFKSLISLSSFQWWFFKNFFAISDSF